MEDRVHTRRVGVDARDVAEQTSSPPVEDAGPPIPPHLPISMVVASSVSQRAPAILGAAAERQETDDVASPLGEQHLLRGVCQDGGKGVGERGRIEAPVAELSDERVPSLGIGAGRETD